VKDIFEGKTVLITGGTGFLGRHLAKEILKYNPHSIRLLSRDEVKHHNVQEQFNYDETLRHFIGDVRDIRRLSKATEGCDIVIHAAAQVMLRKSLEEPVEDAQINIIGTINVLEACRKNNVKRIIYTSTGGARVGEPEYLPVDEKHPLNPCSPYGISKHSAEHYVWMYNQLYGLDYLIFCFGNVYGPRDDPITKRVTAIFADKMIKGEIPTIFGDGDQTRDFIFVEDLAEFIVNSIDKNPEHRLFHLANGKQISVNRIFDILKKLSEFKGEAKHIEAIKGEVRDIVLDTKLAQKELGWKPKHSFEEGLKKTFEWFKSRK